jgi:hypothetical protein
MRKTKSKKETIPENQRLLDRYDAQVYLREIGIRGVSPRFFFTLIADGLPRVRVGRKYFISKVSLDEWIARNERRVPKGNVGA